MAPTICAIAPSPVILQAVPKESIAIYSAIIKAQSASLKPSIDDNKPSDAMMAPPGTPGAAMMVIASMPMKPANIPISKGMSRKSISAMAQHTIFIVEPDMWIVAHKGTTNPATELSTPQAIVCRSVTGMVAADDCVPKAVKYAGNIVFKDLNGGKPENTDANRY